MLKKPSHQQKLVDFKLFLVSLLLSLIAVSVFTVPVAATIMTIQMIDIPKLNEKKLGMSAQRSKILAADGSVLSTFYFENRENVPLGQVPEHFRKAVIAIEDHRFYDHNGVDYKSISRAFISNVKRGGVVEGGSTITQQYVKNTFLNNERSVARKIREAALAYQLEKKLTKDQILELYLNTVYFGNGAYGTKASAEVYFGKSLDQLTLADTALLAGLTKSPNEFSPYHNPEKAKARRNQVLQAMFDNGFIGEAELRGAVVQEMNLRPPQDAGFQNAPYFVEYVRRLAIKKLGKDRFLSGGLTIQTTIDPKAQAYAEDAVAGILNRPGDPSASLVSIDPRTGHIKAMVGGRDFRSDEFNLAVQGRRQAGSSFKTFALVAALEKGISPNTPFSGSSPITIRMPKPGPDWSVKNYGNSSYGTIPLSEATVKSVNVVFAQLIMRVGAKNVAKTAKKMGIKSHVESIPAIALGGLTHGVSPLDMASAYGTLANNGRYVKPVAVTRMVDSKGQVVFEAKSKPRQVLDTGVVFQANNILKQVVARGTATNARIGRPQAGKTGTSQNLWDAWFVGYTPDLSTAVWVGYPKKNVEMNSVHGISVTGGSFPAKIWNSFMSRALQNVPPSDFANPGGTTESEQPNNNGRNQRKRVAPRPQPSEPVTPPPPTPAPPPPVENTPPPPAPEEPVTPPTTGTAN